MLSYRDPHISWNSLLFSGSGKPYSSDFSVSIWWAEHSVRNSKPASSLMNFRNWLLLRQVAIFFFFQDREGSSRYSSSKYPIYCVTDLNVYEIFLCFITSCSTFIMSFSSSSCSVSNLVNPLSLGKS